jgi:hypothetical protein
MITLKVYRSYKQTLPANTPPGNSSDKAVNFP